MIATGPGRITTDARSHRSGYSNWIYLENFDIDGTTVKIEHRNELQRRFAGMESMGDLMIPSVNQWIFLRGYASRTGGAEHNIDLSMQRVFAVQDYLLSLGIANEHITGLDYVGEAWSNAEIEEDDQFRSVEVISRRENIPPPPSTPSFILDRFRMRVRLGTAADAAAAALSIADLPGGLGASILEIQIKNLATGEVQNYLYASAQVTAGLSLPTPSAPPSEAPGPESGWADWVDFRTRSNHHVRFSDFEGEAAFGGLLSLQLGPLGFGDSYFSFESSRLHSVDHYTNVYPRTIVLPMPDSVGLGFSLASLSAFGRLIRTNR